jgi:peptidoglycan/LPS O-acetylase OafA/YrhL
LCLRGPGAGLALDAARGLSADVFASAAFATNIALWPQSGYFDIESAKKPLLHLWSLGTEEQFYLIWPLILMLAARLRLNLLTVALAIGLASFVLNVALIDTNRVATFWLTFSRALELLTGAAPVPRARSSFRRGTCSAMPTAA